MNECLNLLEESDFEFNLGQRLMTAAAKTVSIDESLNQQNSTSTFFDFDAERENLVVPPSAYVNADSEHYNSFLQLKFERGISDMIADR